jgi:hypothetical protein
MLTALTRLSTLLIAATVLPLHSAAAQWSNATIDTLTRNPLRDETVTQSMAIDASDNLHAIWLQERGGGGWRVLHSRRTPGGNWSPASEVGDSSQALYDAALGVNRNTGQPHVAYTAAIAAGNEIVAARDSAGTWVRTRITNNLTEDLSPTIAIDGAGFVHVAWIGKDSTDAWKIFYATDLSGTWLVQLLAASDLGPFGSGASPYIAVTSAGVAHIFYRGGDFGTYHIHHAYNATPGATAWTYEIASTPNGNDFVASAVITSDGTIHLLASGNDGFGFPVAAYYLRKPAGGVWSSADRANPGGSGWGGALFVDQNGKAHITWNEVTGNFYTGNLYYASNTSGTWTTAPIIADMQTFNGSLVLDSGGKGHALAFNGETWESQEIISIHSAGILTSVPALQPGTPSEFTLEQNYPNPFNPTTKIQFSLSLSAGTLHETSLRVYDVLGREIATLVNEELKPGSYEVTFSADGLSSGVYFYRLSAGNIVTARRMVVLK